MFPVRAYVQLDGSAGTCVLVSCSNVAHERETDDLVVNDTS